jgi:hypothetical protein
MSTIDKLTPENSSPENPPTDKPVAAPSPNEFLQQAEMTQPGLVREFWDFLRYNKAWWLTPIILVLLLVGVLAGLAATGAAPFIYAIF